MLICDGGRGTCSLFFSFLPSLESSSCVGWQGGSESYQDWIEGVKASCCSLLRVHSRADNLKQRVRWVDECSAPLNWVIGLPALFLSWGSPCSSAFAVLDLCYLFGRTGCANTISGQNFASVRLLCISALCLPRLDVAVTRGHHGVLGKNTNEGKAERRMDCIGQIQCMDCSAVSVFSKPRLLSESLTWTSVVTECSAVLQSAS